MGQEILYTSAPQGLRPGASGYCTVCSTAGMEPNLAEFLEGFSGYPHPFKPPDPRTRDNPVNYSHIQWTIGGQRYHVLSRVCDAGLDYTGRTNLLAHHVALTRREVERLPGGPAWVMSAGGFFYTQWDGQLRTVPGQKPRTDDVPLARCVAWERAAGDAGYAGLLAEAAKDKGRPVIVIYPAGMDMLPLVVEAQSLLPPDRRWNVTFTTFSSRIYSSFDVQWRFLFGETADARTARRDPHALVIDLCSGPLPTATGGPLVTAAREGRLASRPAAPIRPPREAAATASGRSRRPAAPMEVGAGDLRMLPPELLPDDPAAPPVEEAGVKVSPFERTRQKQRSAWVHYALAFVGGTALALVFFVLLAMSGGNPEPIAQGPKPPDTAGGPPPPEDDKPKDPKPTEERPVEDIVGPITSEPIEDQNPVSAAEVDSFVPPAPPIPMPPVEAGKAPFADFPGDLFELPPRKGSGIGLTPVEAVRPPEAKIYARPPESLKLQLRGKQFAFGAEDAVELKEETEGQDRVWIVSRKRTSGLQRLGRFRLKDNTLSYTWETTIPESAQPEMLRYCLLEISVGDGNSKVCRLSKPKEVPGLPLASIKSNSTIGLENLDTTHFASANTLLLEVRPKNIPTSVKHSPDTPITLGQEQEILINGGPPETEGPRIGLLVQFTTEEGGKSKGVIKVLTKIAFKEPKDKDEHVLVSSRDTLQLTKLGEAAKEARKRVDGFDTQLKRAVSETKTNRERAKTELVGFEERIKECKSSVQSAKEEKGKQFWQGELEKAIQRKERYEKSIDENERDVRRRIEAAEKEAKRAEALYKLADEVCEKGRLEYRIFFKIGERDVELYRTKGFNE